VQAEVDEESLPKTGRAVGIDVGIHHFCIDSDGLAFENPKFIYRTLEKIERVQKQLSRKQRGSNRREKVRLKLAKLYEKLNNQRLDFLHKLSRYYINNYDVICVEDLDVKDLVENGKSSTLNRHIHDSAWSKFLSLLAYKADHKIHNYLSNYHRLWNLHANTAVINGIIEESIPIGLLAQNV